MPAQRNWNITNQHLNRHDNYNIRPRKRLLQCQGTNADQADHGAAKTTMHQQNHCSSHDMTINRPHASRPTPELARHAWVGTGTDSHVGDTVGRHARRPPYPRTPQNTTTLSLRTRPTNIDKLRYTTAGQTKTQITSTETDVPATQTAFDYTTTGSSATEPTQTKPTMRRLRQPRTNHTAAAAAK